MNLGNACYGASDYAEAAEYYRQALEFSRKTGDSDAEGLILMNLGSVSCIIGEYSDAHEHYLKSIELYRDLGNFPNEATVQGNLGVLFTELGDFSRALECHLTSLDLYEKAGRLEGMGSTLSNVASLCFELRDYRSAVSYYDRALEAIRKVGTRLHEATALISLGNAYGELHDLQHAMRYHAEGLGVMKVIGNGRGVVSGLLGLAGDAMNGGDHTAAMEHLIEAARANLELGRTDLAPTIHHNIGNLYLLDPDARLYDPESFTPVASRRKSAGIDYAIRHLSTARAIAESMGSKPLLARILESLVRAYRQSADLELALTCSEERHRIETELFNEESDRRLKSLQVIHETERAMKERELFRAKAEQLQQENDARGRELSALALHLAQKNEMLAELRKRARDISRNYSENARKLAEAMVREIDAAINDDNAWETFNERFQELHQDFLKTLSGRFPSLTPGELRICALLKISLSTKEIASILRVSVRTVEDHRNNIRKKLGLSAKDNFATFLMTL
jgi:tetratricopeptide (TPR) repeat protein